MLTLTTLKSVLDVNASALLICDMQNDYIKPSPEASRQNRRLIANNRRVLDSCRRVPIPVVYSRRVYRHDGLHSSPVHVLRGPTRERPPCMEGTPGVDIIDELRPSNGDVVVDKIRYSAFFGSPLVTILKG